VAIESAFPNSSTRPSVRNFFVILVLLFLISLFIPKGNDVLWINGHHTPLLDDFFKTITNLGDGLVFIPIAVLTLFVGFRYFFALALSATVHGLIVSLFKRVLFHGAERPSSFLSPDLLHFVPGVDVHATNTFPSGHTATAFCAAMAIALIAKNKVVNPIALLIALLVGYSRVYLAQHFLMDVAAGAVMGGVTTFIIWQLFENNQMPQWMNRKLSMPFQIKARNKKQTSVTFSDVNNVTPL
jgi:membrane-associated phospholipid phosphatase